MKERINDLLSAKNREALSSLLLEKHPLPQGVKDWLAQLGLLYGVPFQNLIPDERMLPLESLRVFHIDRNWVKALIDGALSISAHTSKDEEVQKMLMKNIFKHITQNMLMTRKKLRGEWSANEKTYLSFEYFSGMVLRSKLVSGWPGLEIKASFKHPVLDPVKVNILRMERLAPDVMIVIFDRPPNVIEILEPAESLSFGFVNDGNNNQIKLRDIQNNVGQELSNQAVTINDTHYRSTKNRVLNILEIQKSIQNSLGKTITPAGFAVQMVKSPLKQGYYRYYGLRESTTTPPIPKMSIDKAEIYDTFFGE